MRQTAKTSLRRGGLILALAALAIGGADAQTGQTTKVSAKQPSRSSKQPVMPVEMLREQRALDFLKASAARLGAARSMSFTATVSYEYPSKLGPALVYTTRYDVTMQRPDKLKVLTVGDGPVSEFTYDGRTMMAFAPAENLVAVADAPATIDDMLKSAYDKAAIFYPFTDLLVADPYAALGDGARLAFYIGASEQTAGVKTEMLAWANDDVFIQVWIGTDDQLPRRLRAVYRADPLRLRHVMLLSNWQLDRPLAADAFDAGKALGAQKIAFAAPVAPPPGVKPIVKGKPVKSPDKAR